jgi:hypothetical protein
VNVQGLSSLTAGADPARIGSISLLPKTTPLFFAAQADPARLPVPNGQVFVFDSAFINQHGSARRRKATSHPSGLSARYETFAIMTAKILSVIGLEMIHPRRFARVRPNGPSSKVAKIIVAPREPVIDCAIVDYSAGGACLEVSGPIVLPTRFELLWGGTKKKCRVVWKAGRRTGVAF